MKRILLVEDDSVITKSLSAFLEAEGFSVLAVGGQRETLERIDNEAFDLALLDIALGDGNGFAICSAIKAKSDMPVIFVTASDDEFSVVTGLDMGADDYISKPFRPRELLSRIKRVLRRSSNAQSVLEYDGLRVDTDKAVVTRNGGEIYLSALEYRLLLIFFASRGTVLSRARLLEELWDAAGDFVNDNTLTVYIKRLRDKIEDDPQAPVIIKTVRGLGYRLG